MSHPNTAFQVISSCTHCLVEGACSETYDPQAPCHRFGVPVETSCKMCRRTTRGGVWSPNTHDIPTTLSADLDEDSCPHCLEPLDDEARTQYRCPACHLGAYAEITQEPRPLATTEDVQKALLAWAHEDKSESLTEFLETSFEEPSIEAILNAIQTRQPVRTSFDVLGFLFSHMNGGMGGGAPATHEPPTLGRQKSDTQKLQAITKRPPTARIQLPTQLDLSQNPRARFFPLVSVICADGVIREDERSFVDNLLAQHNLPPLEDHELLFRRPHELTRPPTLRQREDILEQMVQLASIDNEKDVTEMRVVRAFARAWGVDPARIELWEQQYDPKQASKTRQLFNKFKSLLLA